MRGMLRKAPGPVRHDSIALVPANWPDPRRESARSCCGLTGRHVMAACLPGSIVEKVSGVRTLNLAEIRNSSRNWTALGESLSGTTHLKATDESRIYFIREARPGAHGWPGRRCRAVRVDDRSPPASCPSARLLSASLRDLALEDMACRTAAWNSPSSSGVMADLFSS